MSTIAIQDYLYEDDNFTVISATKTQNFAERLKKIRETTLDWSTAKKWAFLQKQGIRDFKLNKAHVEKCNKVILSHLTYDFSAKGNWLKKIYIVGDPRTGKTWWIDKIAEIIYQLYHPQGYSIGMIFSNSLKFNLNNLPKAKVVLCVVDDAIEIGQTSQGYLSKENQFLAIRWYKIAHWYTQLTGFTNSFLITIFGSQRYQDLDIRFREAHITVFKNTLSSQEENRKLFFLLGGEIFDYLQRSTLLRNFNFSEFSKYFAIFVDKKHKYFSEFPEAKQHYEKIDLEMGKADATTDLRNQVFSIRYDFLKKYGIELRWEDVARLVGWKEQSDSLAKSIKRYKEQYIPLDKEKFEEIIKDEYYQRKILKILKSRAKSIKSIDEKIEEEINKENNSDLPTNLIITPGQYEEFKSNKLTDEERAQIIRECLKQGHTKEEIINALMKSVIVPSSFKDNEITNNWIKLYAEKEYEKAIKENGGN